MDQRLSTYVERVATACAETSNPNEVPLVVRELAQEHLADGVELEPGMLRLPAEGYGRYLVWRDPYQGFVVVAMVWPAGFVGPPHDHGTWGVVSVLRGRVEVVDYAPPVVAADGRATLAARCTTIGSPGQCVHVGPPPDDWHAVGSASADEGAVTLHTYGCDIRRCRTYDPAVGRLVDSEPVYTTVRPH